jgi:hypothetical protein
MADEADLGDLGSSVGRKRKESSGLGGGSGSSIELLQSTSPRPAPARTGPAVCGEIDGRPTSRARRMSL